MNELVSPFRWLFAYVLIALGSVLIWGIGAGLLALGLAIWTQAVLGDVLTARLAGKGRP